MAPGDNLITERLKAFIDVRFGGNTSAAAKELGISRQAFFPYLNGTSRPGNKFLDRLRSVGLNPAWLLYGDGEMLVASSKYNKVVAERKEIYQVGESDEQRLTLVDMNKKLEIENAVLRGQVEVLKTLIIELKSDA